MHACNVLRRPILLKYNNIAPQKGMCCSRFFLNFDFTAGGNVLHGLVVVVQ